MDYLKVKVHTFMSDSETWIVNSSIDPPFSSVRHSPLKMTMVVSRPSSSSYSKYKRTLKAPGAAVRISTKILQNSPELVQNPAVFRRNISADEKSSSDSGSKKSGSKIRRLKSRKIRTCRVEIFSRPSNLVWLRTRQGDYVRRDLMMEPSFLDKYDVRDQLGKGGFGTVYSGMRRKDGVGVALKHVAKSKVLTWDVINGQRVPQELTFLLNLQSVAGVVKLLDFYEREDSFIYVMEKPREHMDLFDYITNKTRLEEHLARTFFKQVVDIVVACSQAGVVHRDIKDENLVVDLESLQLTLIDFGSAGFTQDKDFRVRQK